MGLRGVSGKEFAQAKAEFAAWEEDDEKKNAKRRAKRMKQRAYEQWQRHEAERRDWVPAAGPEEDGE